MPYRVELSSSSLKKHRVYRVYRVRVCRVMVKFFDYNKDKHFNNTKLLIKKLKINKLYTYYYVYEIYWLNEKI